MIDKIVLDGTCVLCNTLDGTCVLHEVIDGYSEDVLVVRDVNYYEGELTFIPGSDEQIILCDQLTMPGNITINPIPNNYGLITWNGAFLEIS